jgi:hypothetical protein
LIRLQRLRHRYRWLRPNLPQKGHIEKLMVACWSFLASPIATPAHFNKFCFVGERARLEDDEACISDDYCEQISRALRRVRPDVERESQLESDTVAFCYTLPMRV